MAKKFVSTPEEQSHWIAFIQSANILKKISPLELNQKGEPLPQSLSGDYAADMNTLRLALTEDSFTRLHSRYRKFKHRSKSSLTTITLHKNTLSRLKAYASDNGLYSDSIDELIELIIDPEDRFELYQNPSNPDLQSILSVERHLKVTKAKLMLRPHTWRIVTIAIEHAYRAGWLACKQLTGAKRTQNALDQLTASFMDDIQYDKDDQ